jgi:ankyrin repeat protein
MPEHDTSSLLREFADGRTDLIFELLRQSASPDTIEDGASLLQWCAYYGDVSAMKFLLAHGVSLDSLGDDFGLNAAVFHGHWRLCKFLLEHGADANLADPATGETPLHTVLCSTDRLVSDRVLTVLLAHGANPNVATKIGAETGGFMRDARTRGETPLHRAAAFGDENTIQLLLDAGAQIDARDAIGDTPLSWASWYQRPNTILRLLLYGSFRIHPQNQSMRANLLGKPHNVKR